MKNAKADWIRAQCEEIEIYLKKKNNSTRAYQLVMVLTSEKQGYNILLFVLLRSHQKQILVVGFGQGSGRVVGFIPKSFLSVFSKTVKIFHYKGSYSKR